MRNFVVAYVGAAVAMLALDIVWLSTAYEPLYKPLMGHLLAPDIVLWAAVAFYVIYLVGLVVLAVLPAIGSASPWPGTLGRAALYGFCAYATYDLTNMATLKDFPPLVVAIDLVWGTALSTVVGAAALWSMRRFGSV